MMGKNLCKLLERFPNPDSSHFAAKYNTRIPDLWPGSVFSYIRQLWGIYLSYSLGLKLTLRGCRPGFEGNSSQKFIRMLQELYSKLESLGIIRLEYQGFEPLCRLEGSILTANHPSALDAIALFYKIPRLTCVMRASLSQNPFMQGAAQMLGCIPNDTGTAFIRLAAKKLKLGENLLIFPEGTRTARGAALNPFKNGFALIAIRNHSPIHTILIENEHPYLAKGGFLLAPTQLPITVRLKAGKIFYPEPHERPRELTARLQTYFRSALRLSGKAIYVNQEV